MAISKTESGLDSAVPREYRAAGVELFREPLQIEQVARPDLGLGQVRVKVEASGLCHTDIHAAHADWPVKPECYACLLVSCAFPMFHSFRTLAWRVNGGRPSATA